jgi:hypothetical protein
LPAQEDDKPGHVEVYAASARCAFEALEPIGGLPLDAAPYPDVDAGETGRSERRPQRDETHSGLRHRLRGDVWEEVDSHQGFVDPKPAIHEGLVRRVQGSSRRAPTTSAKQLLAAARPFCRLVAHA